MCGNFVIAVSLYEVVKVLIQGFCFTSDEKIMNTSITICNILSLIFK